MIIKGFLYYLLPGFCLKKILRNNSNQFGFLVHLKHISDFKKEYPFLRLFPDYFLSALLHILPPILLAGIEGENSLKNKLSGYLILCPIAARQMLDHRERAKRQIVRALRFSEKLNLRIVGLGGYTASVTEGGGTVAGKFKLGITNGNSFTAVNAMRDINRIVKNKFKNKLATIAVVGATGSIGSEVSRQIAANGLGNLILVGRNRQKLEHLGNTIKPGKKLDVKLTDEISKIAKADLVVVATSASSAIINGDNLKYGAIVYDITQPSNVGRGLAKERPDVLILEGALVQTKNVRYGFGFYLPPNVTYSCLAETMILAIRERFTNFTIGNVTGEKCDEIVRLADGLEFETTSYYSFGREISLDNHKI